MNENRSSSICGLIIAGTMVACSSSSGAPDSSPASGGSGAATGGASGAVSTGGNPGGGTGGTVATGGTEPGTGGASGGATGGRAGASGGNAGGAAGGQGATFYTISPCPGVTPAPGTVASLPQCAACKASHCVPASTAPPDIPAEGDCPDDGSGRPGKCVPDVISDLRGKHTYLPCTMFLLRVPGACVPSCFVPSDAAMYLRQDECADGELCSPCVAPLTGKSLGICESTRCAAR